MDIKYLQKEQRTLLKRIMTAKLHNKVRIYYKINNQLNFVESKKIIEDLNNMGYLVTPLFSIGDDCFLYEIRTVKPIKRYYF